MSRSPPPGLAALLWVLTAGLALPCSIAQGQSRPFQDPSFVERSVDGAPELVVVRERFDPATRRQSLYLRLFETAQEGGVGTLKTVSGRLTVSGAEIDQVLFRASDLRGTDPFGDAVFTYGLEGRAYGTQERGLEGSPLQAVPSAGAVVDALRYTVGGNVLDFSFSTRDGIDDVRVLLLYPAEPAPASFSVQLFHVSECAAFCGPRAWPPGNVRGLTVGQLEPSVTPDDGAYTQSTRVTGLRLFVSDLDVDRRLVDFGQVLAGGAAVSQGLLLDNFAGALDAGGDNGVDLNGPFGHVPASPMPANVDLSRVLLRASPIAGDASLLPGDALVFPPGPIAVPVGQSVPVALQLTVPAGQAPGVYRGTLRVFEDANHDGLDNDDPGETVALLLTVVTSLDGGPPGPDAGVPDAGLAHDAGLAQDAGVAQDAGLAPDGGLRLDAGLPADAGIRPDAGLAHDAGTGPGPGFDPTAFDELQGGARGCAAAGSTASLPGLLLLGLALWALRLRRARAGRGLTCLLLFSLLAAAGLDAAKVSAQAVPSAAPPALRAPDAPYLTLDGADVLAPGEVAAALGAGYSRNPVVRQHDGQLLQVVSRLSTAEVAVSVGVLPRLQLGVGYAFAALSGYAMTGAPLASSAFGDLRITPEFRLFTFGRLSASLAVDVLFPVGDATSYFAEASLSATPRLALELAWPRVRAAVNLAYTFRRPLQAGRLELGDVISYAAAVRGELHARLGVIAEVRGATSAIYPFRYESENPLDVALGLRFDLGLGVSLAAGASFGLQRAFGAPLYRAFAGVAFALPSGASSGAGRREAHSGPGKPPPEPPRFSEAALLPLDEPLSEVAAEAAQLLASLTEPSLQLEAQPALLREPLPEPEPQPEPEAELYAELEPQLEATSKPEPEPQLEASLEPEPEPQLEASLEPEPKPEPEPEPKPEPKPQPERAAEPPVKIAATPERPAAEPVAQWKRAAYLVPATTSPAPAQQRFVVWPTAVARARAGSLAKLLGHLRLGARISVTGRAGPWSRIPLAEKEPVWIHHTYVGRALPRTTTLCARGRLALVRRQLNAAAEYLELARTLGHREPSCAEALAETLRLLGETSGVPGAARARR